jgi:hypothetical protein
VAHLALEFDISAFLHQHKHFVRTTVLRGFEKLGSRQDRFANKKYTMTMPRRILNRV